jgi:hypothetical protein
MRHRLLDRRPLLASGNHHQTVHPQGIERLPLAGARVGRRKSCGVDQHQFFVGELRQQLGQMGLVRDPVQRHAQQVGIHRQLRCCADAVGIGGHQRHLCGTVRIHAARGKLGQRGGLARAGGADQCVTAAPRQQVGFTPQYRQVADQHLAQPALGGVSI